MDRQHPFQPLNQPESPDYRLVDEALRTVPLQAVPADLLPEVMRRIQARPQVFRWYSPRRGWVYSLGAALALTLLLVWRLWLLLPVDWPARAQFRLLVWQHNLNFLLPQYSLAAGIWMMLVGLAVLAGLLSWKVLPQRPI